MPAIRTTALADWARTLRQPLTLAALFTMASVGLSLRWSQQPVLAGSVLVAFAALFLLCDLPRAPWRRDALLVALGLLALVLVWLEPVPNVAPVLLVIWVAVLATQWPPLPVLVATLVADLAFYLVMRDSGHRMPSLLVMIHMGFQGFAALCAHYARSAERARDRLALVNADLLATRALLADSARDAERLRVARELHDVAGHKLTAMMLNLRALAADPAFADRNELAVSQRMAGELLGDIRNVVHALRDARGLDLATALRALAAPLPRPALRLDIDDDVRIDDPALAETVLRLVQEALTNAARHADADHVDVRLHHRRGRLAVCVEDDGRVRGPLREGNGLAGMRERIHAAGGTLRLATSERGAMRIDAELPL